MRVRARVSHWLKLLPGVQVEPVGVDVKRDGRVVGRVVGIEVLPDGTPELNIELTDPETIRAVSGEGRGISIRGGGFGAVGSGGGAGGHGSVEDGDES